MKLVELGDRYRDAWLVEKTALAPGVDILVEGVIFEDLVYVRESVELKEYILPSKRVGPFQYLRKLDDPYFTAWHGKVGFFRDEIIYVTIHDWGLWDFYDEEDFKRMVLK